MNRVATFLIAAIVVGFIADTAPAQIGRGRLLKKMRDDIFGPPINQAQLEREQALARQKLEAARRAQLETQKRAAAAAKGRQPTPIGTGSKASNQQTAQPTQRPQPLETSRQTSRQTPRPPQQYRRANPKPNASTARKTPKGPAKSGFGFYVVEKNEKLIISKIDPNGNAAGVGFRPGDVLTAIGGVEVDTTVAFDEIADILSNGDSIGIAYQRDGKSDEVQVSYGEAPNSEESPTVAIEGSLEPTGSLSRSQRVADFAPPRQGVSNQQSSRSLRTPYGATRTPSQIEQLNSTVRQQSQKIQLLENELRALRRLEGGQGTGNARVPTRGVKSVLDPAIK